MSSFTYSTSFEKNDPLTLQRLVSEAIRFSKKYLDFVKNFIPNASFVEIKFYEFDCDFFEENVSKWHITFDVSEFNSFVFSGYSKEHFLEIFKISSGELVFKNNINDFFEFINSPPFSSYSQEDFDSLFKLKEILFDFCQAAFPDGVPGFKTIFSPSPIEDESAILERINQNN